MFQNRLPTFKKVLTFQKFGESRTTISETEKNVPGPPGQF